MTAAALAASTSAHADGRIEVGGYAGADSTTMVTTYDCPPPDGPTDVCVAESRPHEGALGIALGGYVRWPVLRPLLLEANLMYAQKGYKGGDARLHYLELPLLVRVDPFGDQSPGRVFVYAGLAPALSVACHMSGTRFDNDIHQPVPYSDPCGTWPFYPLAPNRFDLGGVIGGGAGWELSFGVIELHLRYVQGLLDNDVLGEGGKTVNKAVYLFAGFGKKLGTR